jgi:hypothetical protein
MPFGQQGLAGVLRIDVDDAPAQLGPNRPQCVEQARIIGTVGARLDEDEPFESESPGKRQVCA